MTQYMPMFYGSSGYNHLKDDQKISRTTRQRSFIFFHCLLHLSGFLHHHTHTYTHLTSCLYWYPSNSLVVLYLFFSAGFQGAALILKTERILRSLLVHFRFYRREKYDSLKTNSFCHVRWYTPDEMSPKSLLCFLSKPERILHTHPHFKHTSSLYIIFVPSNPNHNITAFSLRR